MPTILRNLAVALLVLGCATARPEANLFATSQQRTLPDDSWCEDQEEDSYCEVREVTLAADRDVVAVNARPNGGVSVEGWDRNEILVRAKVYARSDSESEARELVGDVKVSTSGRTIGADGPRTGRDEWWAVSFRLFVPRNANLDLESLNGGIAIKDVSGKLDFRTTNGGVSLSGLKGDVKGQTTNGSLSVDLTGDRWEGEGLDVHTTNGGVKIRIPESYNAELETGTVNGSFRIDFPVMVQGRIDRRIEARLGSGGKTIRAFTTNGSVVVSKS